MVYLDNAATTPLNTAAISAMTHVMTETFGNPSSLHAYGRQASKELREAREEMAKQFEVPTRKLIFTSGGTEGNNTAIKGYALANQAKGKHLITTAIEHHAILHTCQFLETQGYEVTYLPVDEYGKVSLEDVKNAIRPDTILISVMFANNEIGTIEPIAEIGKIAHEHGIIFHTDAVQAVGHVPIDVKAMNIDLLSMSGHKFYGPKGIGALYIKKGVKIGPFIHGGAQERNRRAGTENVPGIVGMGLALELAVNELNEEMARLKKLREKLIHGILDNIPYARLNGHPEDRLPGNVNISFEYIEGESILLLLDMKGICASSGSACTSGSLDPSHVLLAIGLPHEKAHGSIRLTMGHFTTEEQVDYVIEAFPPIINRLRQMSPLFEGVENK